MTHNEQQPDSPTVEGSPSALRRQSSDLAYRPWLHRFACLLVATTFVLVASGGNVTSHDAGLSVPDGFTVYGHFLWTFPFEQWVGNILHEHIHRLKGSLVGLMSIALAIWLWRTQRRRRWLRYFGLAVLGAVIFQGLLGGLRVEFVNWYYALATPVAVLHAVAGQVFLCLTVLAAAATSRWWIERRQTGALAPPPLRGNSTTLAGAALLIALLVQLVLGATMRHTGAGLAIPDFPTSYGRIIPPLTQADINAELDHLPYDQISQTFTPTQVVVHFAHRVWAVVVLVMTVVILTRMAGRANGQAAVLRPAAALVGLLVLQVALGAMVIWTGKSAHVATAHQAVGAVVLGVATLLVVRFHLLGEPPKSNLDQTAVQPWPRAAVHVEGA